MVLLTKCMAIDHGHEQIRVNAICPSFVETDLTAAVISQAPDPNSVRAERITVHPSAASASRKISPDSQSILPAMSLPG